MVKLRSLKNSDFFTKFGLFSDPFTAKSPNSDSKRKFGPKWQQCKVTPRQLHAKYCIATQELVLHLSNNTNFWHKNGYITNRQQSITHRLNKLKLLPLLNFLNQTNVLQRSPGKVSLLHLQRGVRLKLVDHVKLWIESSRRKLPKCTWKRNCR